MSEEYEYGRCVSSKEGLLELLGKKKKKKRIQDIDSSDQDLRDCDFGNATLEECQLEDSSFQGASLGGAVIRWCATQQANFNGADMRGVKLVGDIMAGFDTDDGPEVFVRLQRLS